MEDPATQPVSTKLDRARSLLCHVEANIESLNRMIEESRGAGGTMPMSDVAREALLDAHNQMSKVHDHAKDRLHQAEDEAIAKGMGHTSPTLSA